MLFNAVPCLGLRSSAAMWPGVPIAASGGVSDGMDQLASTAVTAVVSASAGFGFTRSTGRNTSIGKEVVRVRIRSIKPEFWRSDDIDALSVFERLLFIGLWSYVDCC